MHTTRNSSLIHKKSNRTKIYACGIIFPEKKNTEPSIFTTNLIFLNFIVNYRLLEYVSENDLDKAPTPSHLTHKRNVGIKQSGGFCTSLKC